MPHLSLVGRCGSWAMDAGLGLPRRPLYLDAHVRAAEEQWFAAIHAAAAAGWKSETIAAAAGVDAAELKKDPRPRRILGRLVLRISGAHAAEGAVQPHQSRDPSPDTATRLPTSIRGSRSSGAPLCLRCRFHRAGPGSFQFHPCPCNSGCHDCVSAAGRRGDHGERQALVACPVRRRQAFLRRRRSGPSASLDVLLPETSD